MTPSASGYIHIAEPTPGKTIGYIRVSTVAQNPERQLEGVNLDKVFTDFASGKDTNRPQLQAMLEYVREGDVLLVHSLDRLARNLVDLRRMVTDLTGRGVRVEFRKENMVFDGNETAMGTLLLNMMGGFAEFERALSRERQLEGVAIAKKAGKYKGRAPAIRANNGRIDLLERLYAEGAGVSIMARQAGVSRQTVYDWLKTKPKREVGGRKLTGCVVSFPQKEAVNG
jgi:DNA invertase Pin-like site-specific DNA recombinase